MDDKTIIDYATPPKRSSNSKRDTVIGIILILFLLYLLYWNL